MMALGDGDWVEGAPQWWWKYVFPSRERFWLSILTPKFSQVADPQPEPWFQGVSAEILEGLVMLHAAATVPEEAVRVRLKEEAAQKLTQAVQAIG
jgi:hypothetical protein